MAVLAACSPGSVRGIFLFTSVPESDSRLIVVIQLNHDALAITNYYDQCSSVKFKQSIGLQLQKRKELLYNLGAISSYSSMLIFFWHGVVILLSKQQPKHTLVLYAASTLFSILVMAPYKWDKKWMRIKTSVGITIFGLSLLICLFCLWAY